MTRSAGSVSPVPRTKSRTDRPRKRQRKPSSDASREFRRSHLHPWTSPPSANLRQMNRVAVKSSGLRRIACCKFQRDYHANSQVSPAAGKTKLIAV
ncbi:hypothetical protein FGIG_12276 [Fasciola gigantica]|uniref:Uncharacterized protein n=1 Tax=Fasciola gigantica TaxID=46835 RepID=A0A504Z1D7_FASGI|nr:hypothetical protein FGIG_12276 [Fasciola gigantica]